MTKREENEIYTILDSTYPNVKTALDFTNPVECWVAVVLSAQCTDKRVNTITPSLFKKYKTIKDYANANFDELKKFIYSSGYYNSKTKKIIDGAKYFQKLGFEGTILPNKFEELHNAPGIGKKTANVIYSQIFNLNEGIAIDTHNKRIAARIGISTGNVKQIEEKLMKIYPRKNWRKISLLFVEHGRNICTARNPKCNICPINKYCKYYNETYLNDK